MKMKRQQTIQPPCTCPECLKEYDKREVKRVYGESFSDFGYCSPQCYTKSSQNSNDYNVKGNAAPAGNDPRPKYEGRIKNITIDKWVSEDSVFTPNINLGYAVKEKYALIFCDEAEANSTLDLLNDSLDYCFTLIENVSTPPPAGNDRPEYEAVILNITKGKYVGPTLKSGKISHVKNRKDAVLFWDEYEANAELERLNDVMADCYSLVETTPQPSGNDPETERENEEFENARRTELIEAGNDLPQQLFVDLGDFDRTGEPDEIFIRTALKGEPFDVCSFSAHETDFPKDYAQEIVRRYNNFPALQEQNRELLEALKLLHKGANLCDMAFTPANISAGMLITKYSK